MSDDDNISQLVSQGNINFIIIKNSQTILSYEEYVEESLKLCNGFNGYDNLNMNILFIHNVIEDACEKDRSAEIDEKQNYGTDEIKVLNSNINIMILKNIINIKGANK